MRTHEGMDYTEEKINTGDPREAVARAGFFDADEDMDDIDAPPPIKSAFVTGFDRNPTKKRERPIREENERFKPASKEEEPEVMPREEHPPERHKRRETATTRLLNNAEEPPEPEHRERNSRRRNPAPKPAVRVNVPSERKVRNPQGEPMQDRQRENSAEEDLDTFRRRYNSDELFSPPRNPNRPVRQGRSDVRTNRIKPGERDSETVGITRIILAGSLIAALGVVTILTWQMMSFRSAYNEAQSDLISAHAAVTAAHTEAELTNRDLLYQRDNLLSQISALEALFYSYGIDPNAPPPPPDDGTRPGEGATQTTPSTPTLPTEHMVVTGENLSRIAQKYFGNSEPATLEHIRSTNNLRSINDIQAGRPLTITPMS